MRKLMAIRELDRLGRIVIPKNLRKKLGMNARVPIEFLFQGDTLILKRYESKCIICTSTKHISQFKGKNLCAECRDEIRNIVLD